MVVGISGLRALSEDLLSLDDLARASLEELARAFSDSLARAS